MSSAKQGTVIPMHRNQNKGVSRKKTVKKVSPALASFATALVFLTLFSACLALVYFNFRNLGTEVLRILRTNDTLYLEEIEEIRKEKMSLQEKEEELRLLETSLKRKEADLNKKQNDLDKAYELLQTEEDRLAKMAEKATEESEALKSLVDIYKSMEPRVAASIMEKQEDDRMIADILKSMKSSSAAGILSFMDAEKAANIMKEISGKGGTK
ncbi:MAG: MotE family protein [Clostridia bacterium]|jgi:flagellar motility protein MotE (MotC chaperone)